MIRILASNTDTGGASSAKCTKFQKFGKIVAKAMRVVKGTPSTTNGLESRTNKTIKRHLVHPNGFAALVNKLPKVLTTAQRNLSQLGYSFMQDQTGMWTSTQKNNVSGYSPATKTSRDFKTHFTIGVDRFERCPNDDLFFWSYPIHGIDGTCYISASTQCREVLYKMLDFEDQERAVQNVKEYMRHNVFNPWLDFIHDPEGHVRDLDEACKCFDEKRAQKHMLDRNAFATKGEKWDPENEGHRFRLISQDFLFYAWAFKVLCPNPNHISDDQASRFFVEDWRRGVDHAVDYADYTSLFCPQFGNYGFSSDIVQATLASKTKNRALPEFLYPVTFERTGQTRSVRKAKNRHGKGHDLWSPQKPLKGKVKQRWSSQDKKRKAKRSKGSKGGE